MAEVVSLFRRGMEKLGLVSPAEHASPEQDGGPPDMTGLFTRAPGYLYGHSGTYLKGLMPNDDTILAREGAQDLRLFDRLLDDDVAMSCLQQRRLAITSRDWEVAPGDAEDDRSVKAANEFRAMLQEAGCDRITGNLHYAVWYGYGVGEGLYGTREFGGRRIVWLDDIVVPDRRWFGFTGEGELRMLSPLSPFDGVAVPPNKFVTIRTGGTHDFAFYGLGLAHWCYWPVWFKRAAVRNWALYLEKLSNPTAVGGFSDQDTVEDKNLLLQTLTAIGRDTAAIMPEHLVGTIKFMESARTSTGTSGYREFATEHNEALMRIILGQPGTSKATAQGIGSGQAESHADVKAELVKADSDLISEGLNTFARWITRWNHGDDVAPPTIYRVLDDVEDMNSIADRDVKLNGLGWRRTDESVEQVYGEGYERKPEVTPPAQLDPRQPANDDQQDDQQRASLFTATEEDQIEALTQALMNEADPFFTEFAASLKDSLTTARENAGGTLSLEGARVALLQAFERYEPAKLAKLTGLAFVAERGAAQVGAEEDVRG